MTIYVKTHSQMEFDAVRILLEKNGYEIELSDRVTIEKRKQMWHYLRNGSEVEYVIQEMDVE